MTTFRVHIENAGHVDVSANTPAEARAAAVKGRPGAIVTKIKRVRS